MEQEPVLMTQPVIETPKTEETVPVKVTEVDTSTAKPAETKPEENEAVETTPETESEVKTVNLVQQQQNQSEEEEKEMEESANDEESEEDSLEGVEISAEQLDQRLNKILAKIDSNKSLLIATKDMASKVDEYVNMACKQYTKIPSLPAFDLAPA